MGWHTPWQLQPSAQTTPQAPQLALSKSRLVQMPLHIVPPAPQPLPPPLQVPLTQVVPAPQTFPQAPQLAASVDVLTHAVPQRVWPATHALHVPFTQYGVAPLQTRPQAPQLPVSVLRSAQRPLQHDLPLALQLFPHAPQFGSDLRSLHTPLHAAVAQQT
jgi:hypothetical protein